ncbi:hypothetical protein GCM10018980_70240 [Streptomyces capoamus]|uniref:Uncharacterized protein n=1 Tax=Streptomyces capoamus TaxID=68183 RepID=A0A919F2V1_9ACTN|nr:hypothetical protein [Streptomyces capoamus]GGW18194.1 hypothetical protein GCM10010501_43500 [Streptomyces libani subsp. rufus]GHG73709.1 hypothetical protein GCM10018980_70240 [Streptomyces capoamus]
MVVVDVFAKMRGRAPAGLSATSQPRSPEPGTNGIAGALTPRSHRSVPAGRLAGILHVTGHAEEEAEDALGFQPASQHCRPCS